MPSQPRLFLIDGHALAYRTYFALTGAGGGSRWITRAGEPTAGTFGFTSVLLKLLDDEQPEYLAVSFDVGRTFRDDLYAEYKGTRDKMPDDLRLQIERIRQLVKAFGIPILEAEGYEADDVLGTVARQASGQGVRVVILTGDRDLLQLTDKDVVIRLAGQKLSEAKDYGLEEVEARYGLQARQLIDLKALMGDSSDNIPGVKGVGEKTAVKLLQQYGDLDSIYEHLDEIGSRFSNKLEAGQELAYLSRDLGRIVTDVPLEFDLERCRVGEYDRDQVVELFRELEFRSLLGRLDEVAEATAEQGQQLSMFVSRETQPTNVDSDVQVIDDPEKLATLARRLGQAGQIAFDVETTDTDVMRARLVGISLAAEAGAGFYIPVGHHPDLAGGPQLELQTVIEALRPALENPKIPKVGHNLKYDYTMLARAGVEPTPLAFDTMLAEWLCDPGSRNLGLKNLAWMRLGLEMTEIQELIGKGKNQRTMDKVPIADVAPYAVADAEICLRLKPQLEVELKEKQQLTMFNDLEMPLISILSQMERDGIALDHEFLGQFSRQLGERQAQIEAEIYELAGLAFNVNSTQQLSRVLFENLKLNPPDGARKTASGHYSTAAGVLEQLEDVHPIVALILEQREVAKLQSTYAEALPAQVHPQTGRVHTSYNQTGSITGRLASSDPNLQNIPIRTELGREIRRAFIAAEGNLLLGVDYSQIELRIVAHMADDEAMIAAFLDDQDIHAATAAAVFGIDPDHVSSEMRRRAKAVNFGLMYGMSAYGLTRSTDLTLAEAEDFVKIYFERFPGVRVFLDSLRLQAARDGYVETLFGRRRYFPQLTGDTSVSAVARNRAEREAINAPVQGTAADIIKLAMLKIPDALNKAGLKARMLLQVHDELVFECPQDELAPTASLVQKIMREATSLKVPLKTEAKAGPNWLEMKLL